MAALSTRDELEAAFAERLATLSGQHRRELATLLGDPPDVLNVPDAFWHRVHRENEETAAAAMLLIFLAAADEHGWSGSPAVIAGEGYIAQRSAFFADFWVGTSRTMLADASDRWRLQQRRGAGDVSTVESAGTDGATLTGNVEGIDPKEVEDVLLKIFGPDRVARAVVTETTAAEFGGANAAAEASTTPFVRVWRHGSHRPRGHAGSTHDPCPHCTPILDMDEAQWTVIHPDLAGPPLHINCDCFIEFVDPETGKPVKLDFDQYGFLTPPTTD